MFHKMGKSDKELVSINPRKYLRINRGVRLHFFSKFRVVRKLIIFRIYPVLTRKKRKSGIKGKSIRILNNQMIKNMIEFL